MFTCSLLTTEGFLEVAIESWSEWDLNRQPLDFVQLYVIPQKTIHLFKFLPYFFTKIFASNIQVYIFI